MSTIEIVIAVLGILASTLVAYLAYRRGSRADDVAEANSLASGYDALIQRYQAELQDRDKKLMGAVTPLVQAKADNGYVEALEKRLDSAWIRIDSTIKRLEEAEKDFEDCKKEMGEKIQILEARLGGKKDG